MNKNSGTFGNSVDLSLSPHKRVLLGKISFKCQLLLIGLLLSKGLMGYYIFIKTIVVF